MMLIPLWPGEFSCNIGRIQSILRWHLYLVTFLIALVRLLHTFLLCLRSISWRLILATESQQYYLFYVAISSQKNLKFFRVPEMFMSGHIFHKSVQTQTPFLNKDGLCISHQFFRRKSWYETSRPSMNHRSSGIIKIAISFLVLKTSMLIFSFDSIDRINFNGSFFLSWIRCTCNNLYRIDHT